LIKSKTNELNTSITAYIDLPKIFLAESTRNQKQTKLKKEKYLIIKK